MTRNKPRLELAIYARPKHPESPHYALFVAPKRDAGPIVKHHVKNTWQVDDSGQASRPWRYERTVVASLENEPRLLARVIVAKVLRTEEVQQVFYSIPVNTEDGGIVAVEMAASFSCKSWVKDAWEGLRRRRAIFSKFEDWDVVERQAPEYVEKKRQQGRWDSSSKGAAGVPLMDLLEGKERVA
ncbi:hypothetical protein CKM354_000248900 [Cercospora kikuchii]|uniref:Uncharacterized protein n=1 Tax=Cercospora kikuchii TaxID=84275 RepID=A0A9P3CA62_9PEZI|nr:uncharacterized protein CKM354_000248900 [Cercospora kikuchii]GIZ39098.1 hypothetical protein CKM354_000248900 [Cercospora kikuchii]